MTAPRYILLALGLIAAPLAGQQPAPATTAGTGVTVAGVAFVQYGYGLQVDSSLSTPSHANNFDVTRTFVHVLGRFGEGVSTRVTFDVDGRKAAANQLTLRLAYAYVSWQPHAQGPLTWKIGLMHTPWNEFEESVWDYRMQGKSVLDRNGYTTTQDFGAGVDGSWDHDRVNLQAGIYNGEGGYNALGDQGKDVSARVSVRLAETSLPGRVGGLRLSGFAQLGKATGGGTRRRFVGMLSWKSKTVTIAGLVAATEDSLAPALAHEGGRILSAFAVYDVPRTRLALLGRLDRVDPDADSTSQLLNSAANVAVNPQTRIIAGVSYVVSPNFRVLTDLDLVSVANGATNVFDRSRQNLYLHVEFRF